MLGVDRRLHASANAARSLGAGSEDAPSASANRLRQRLFGCIFGVSSVRCKVSTTGPSYPDGAARRPPAGSPLPALAGEGQVDCHDVSPPRRTIGGHTAMTTHAIRLYQGVVDTQRGDQAKPLLVVHSRPWPLTTSRMVRPTASNAPAGEVRRVGCVLASIQVVAPSGAWRSA